MEGLIREIESKVKKAMTGSPPSHDYLHVLRVRDLALEIGKQLGADLEVLSIAALLHDIGLEEELQGKGDHALASARIARHLLTGKIDDEKLYKIIDAIHNHRYKNGRKPKYLEGLILQDADRLDALGAIGIARAFASAKGKGQLLYNPGDPLWKGNRELDDDTYTLDHFYKKLLKLKDSMNTEPGKALAKKRTRFMQEFLHELEVEIMRDDNKR